MSASDDEEPRPRQPEIDNSNMDLPALFWDSIPEKAEDHPDYAAFQALEDESTPEERAESLKVPYQIPAMISLYYCAQFYMLRLAHRTRSSGNHFAGLHRRKPATKS
jgi:hypothetical protein